MKNQILKVITFCYLLVLTSCVSTPSKPMPTSNTDYENIIGIPIKIGNIEVAQYDFPNAVILDDAKIFCAALGSGWRLPTSVELNTLYQNKDKIRGFADRFYWSSSEFQNDNPNVQVQNFASGSGYTEDKNNAYYVRAVR